MAYVVKRPSDRWEVRESRATPEGPRSRTLATFKRLSPDVIERASKRSHGVLTGGELRRLATRAGAPIEESPSDEAAAKLLSELEHGRGPSPARRRMLAAALADPSEPTEAERAVAPWLAATLEDRGRALYDLLVLTESLPVSKRPDKLTFPRLGAAAR